MPRIGIWCEAFFLAKHLQVSKDCCNFAPRKYKQLENMTTRREKSKPQKPQLNSQLEMMTEQPKPRVNQRKEKFANFLIDVAKYVLTGVVITSLFNDVTDKTTIYLIGLGVVGLTLLLGLSLTSKRKE